MVKRLPFISASERLRPTQIAGLCLAFGALALAFRDGLVGPASQPSRQWLGDCLSVVAAAFWGLTTLWIRATPLATATPERTLFLQLAVSAPIMALASVLAMASFVPTQAAMPLPAPVINTRRRFVSIGTVRVLC